jgi:hypothetical protein
MDIKGLLKDTFVGNLVKPKSMQQMEDKALGITTKPALAGPPTPAPTGYQPGDIMKQEEALKKSKKGFTKGVGGE